MTEYKCPRCGYITQHKGHIKRHFNRKILCIPKLKRIPIDICKENVDNLEKIPINQNVVNNTSTVNNNNTSIVNNTINIISPGFKLQSFYRPDFTVVRHLIKDWMDECDNTKKVNIGIICDKTIFNNEYPEFFYFFKMNISHNYSFVFDGNYYNQKKLDIASKIYVDTLTNYIFNDFNSEDIPNIIKIFERRLNKPNIKRKYTKEIESILNKNIPNLIQSLSS